MTSKGRPIKSPIRQNIVEILHVMGTGYGYDIHHVYQEIFPKVTMRSIYYNLRKGVDLKEIRIDQVKKEKGEFSWGGEVEKIYYGLGPNAMPKGLDIVKIYFEKKRKSTTSQ